MDPFHNFCVEGKCQYGDMGEGSMEVDLTDII